MLLAICNRKTVCDKTSVNMAHTDRRFVANGFSIVSFHNWSREHTYGRLTACAITAFISARNNLKLISVSETRSNASGARIRHRSRDLCGSMAFPVNGWVTDQWRRKRRRTVDDGSQRAFDLTMRSTPGRCACQMRRTGELQTERC